MTGIDLVVIAGALAAIALVNWWFFVAGRTVAVAAPVLASDAARSGAAAVAAIPEVVIVVDGGYAPNTIRAKAGQPLRLVFDRQDDSSCSEEVVIPALGVRKYLPTGTRTAIDITPAESGRIPFTCGMGMLKGTILVDA
jgi:plastocyanin domain-containing protein